MLFNSLAPKDKWTSSLNGFDQWESSRLFMIGDGSYAFQLGVLSEVFSLVSLNVWRLLRLSKSGLCKHV